jgi:heptosyltransferase-2
MLSPAGWGRTLRRLGNSPRLQRAVFGPFVRRPAAGPVRSILVIRPDHIGDFVLGVPLLRALAQAHPGAALHLAVPSSLADLARGCPWVTSVVTLPDGIACWCPASQTPLRRLVRLVWFTLRRLRPLRPDLAILPRVDTDAHGGGQMLLFSGAPRRVGFAATTTALRQLDNPGSDAYLTDVVRTAGQQHEVAASRSLAAALGIDQADWRLALWDTAAERRNVADRLAAAGLERRRLAVIAPGATAPQRRWPADHFAAVGRALVDEGMAVCVVGTRADTPAAQVILAALPRHARLDLTGSLSLTETTALLRRAGIFIGNDSGPLHLAAAAGIPCVEISSFPRDGDPMHHNSPLRFGPWGVPHRILQPAAARPPCRGGCTAAEAHCILAIEPHAVVAAVHDLLEVVPADHSQPESCS